MKLQSSTFKLQTRNPQPQTQEAEEADAAVTERLLSALAASLQDLQVLPFRTFNAPRTLRPSSVPLDLVSSQRGDVIDWSVDSEGEKGEEADAAVTERLLSALAATLQDLQVLPFRTLRCFQCPPTGSLPDVRTVKRICCEPGA